MAAEARRLKAQEELAKLRAEASSAQKAEESSRERQARGAAKKVEEETRRKIEAEMAGRRRPTRTRRAKADAEAAARRKAEEDARKAAEAAEHVGMRLTLLDRQHHPGRADGARLQRPAATDGDASAPRTREMIAAWQNDATERPADRLS